MTAAEVLEFAWRPPIAGDGVVFITEAELAGWPTVPVAFLKESGLLIAASSARSATCDGCESRCSMAVEVLDYPCGKAAFIFCDKRDDMDRIEVPLDRLRRWQATGGALAAFLATSLGVGRLHGIPVSTSQWPVGRFRAARAENVILEKKDGELVVCIAGHGISVADIAALEADGLAVRIERLIEAVAHPAVGGGRREARSVRAMRLAHQFDELKAAGHRAPRQILSAEENVGVEAIKKLLDEGRALIRGKVPKKG